MEPNVVLQIECVKNYTKLGSCIMQKAGKLWTFYGQIVNKKLGKSD